MLNDNERREADEEERESMDPKIWKDESTQEMADFMDRYDLDRKELKRVMELIEEEGMDEERAVGLVRDGF